MASSSVGKAAPLDGFFHYRERGGTFGAEVGAGVLMAILSICGIFMNMQLVATLSISGAYADASAAQVSANGEVYAALYFVSMVVSCAGTALVGLLTRLPLVQTTSISLSVVLVSIVGASTGLTYYNLLFVVFVSSIVFLVVSLVPQLRSFVTDGLPRPVRKALPAAMGILLAWVAAQLSGVMGVVSSAMPIYGSNSVVGGAQSVQLSMVDSLSGFSYLTDKFHPMLLLSALAAIVAIVVYLLSRLRSRHPLLLSLMVATLFFLLASVLLTNVNWKMMKLTFDSLWARAWMVGSEDAMQAHLSGALSSLSVGRVLTEGADFSAYVEQGGNVVVLIASGVLTFLFLNTFGSVGVADATVAERSRLSDAVGRGTGLALVSNAAINVVSALVGAPPVALGAESVAGVKDRARSGLSSVVAAVLMLVSAFVWLIPALFATITSYTVSFNMYGHYGTVLQLLSQCSFTVVDIVMMIVGISMAVHSLDLDWKSVPEAAPFAATVAGTFLSSNLAFGVALGIIASVLVQVVPRRRPASSSDAPRGLIARVGGARTLAWAAISLALVVLSLI